MHVQKKLIVFLIAISTFLAGCGGIQVVHHKLPSDTITVVDHIPEEAIDRNGNLNAALKKGVLYRAIIVSSVWEWGGLLQVSVGHHGQCRYGYYGGARFTEWSIILCFDRRDIAPGLVGSVTDGWFELIYSDPHQGIHVYQWRDSRTVYYQYDRYRPPPRAGDRFHVQNKALMK